jgi:benzoate-CoA ligase family protein
MDTNDVCLRPWEAGFSLPEKFNMVSLYLDRHIEGGRGGRTAIHYNDRTYTYRDVFELTNRAGNGFAKLGVQKGDRVIMMMYDSPYWVAVYLGAMKIGAVPVPVNVLATPSNLAYFIQDSKASVLVVEQDLLEKIENLSSLETRIVVRGEPGKNMVSLLEMIESASPHLEACATTPLDHSYWLYTSGTTGRPKGVIHLHKDLVYAIEVYGSTIGFTSDDICYGVPKLFFSYGLNMGLQLPFYYGASVALCEDRPLPAGVLANLEKFRPTMFFSVPTAYAQLLHHLEANKLNPDLACLRISTSAGEALPAVIYNRWFERFHVEILDGLGSSEVSWIYITSHPGKVKIGYCGNVMPGYQVKLLDENGDDVPTGVMGDLWVKADSVTCGYWNNPEQNAESFRDGWMKTGDCCIKDAEGYYEHCGRSNDTIKVSGIWVSPLEVEATLLEHEAVVQCAVVGKRDENSLIKPKAFVVLKSGYAPDEKMAKELQNFVKSRLAPYKYPRWVEFRDELPMTATGKIQRFMLRDS